MPPKKVTCAICKDEVLKARTLARKDGTRACRSHEGIEGESKKLQEEEKEKRAQRKNTIKRRFESNQSFQSKRKYPTKEEMQKFGEFARSHCWACGNEGISIRQYYTDLLITTKRIELHGEFNLLDLPQKIRELIGPQRVIVEIKLTEAQVNYITRHLKDARLCDIVRFVPVVTICNECTKKHNFDDLYKAAWPKEPTFEQVKNFMPVMQLIEPFIEAEAKRRDGTN